MAQGSLIVSWAIDSGALGRWIMKRINKLHSGCALLLSIIVVAPSVSACPVPAAQGVQPFPSQASPVFDKAAQNQLGSDGPSYPTMLKGYPTATRVAGSVPCIILKAVGYVESSSWRQFNASSGQTGPTVISGDCGYGIMQITSGMSGGAGFDPNRVAAEYPYNIGTGAKILIDKWNATPTVGDNDPNVPEDWYFAVWAYNSFSYINNPNNPRYDPNRPAYNGTQPRVNYPYQELVWGRAANPPSSDYWAPIPLTLINRALIPNTSVVSGHFQTPTPVHANGCQTVTAKASMSSPTPGSTFTSSSVTFSWSSGTGVSQYFLYLGNTVGANDIYGQSQGTNRSVTVSSIPADGRTIYVRLWSLLSTGWQFNDYTYRAKS